MSTKRLFRALTLEVGAWWTDPFRMLAPSTSLNLDPAPGGHFLETGTKGSWWIWASVTGVKPDRFLELTGRFGMAGAVAGAVAYELTPKGRGGSMLKATHVAVGDIGKSDWKSYTFGWEQLLDKKLRAYLRRNSKRR
ncbi:MAG: hypothetical protein L3K15_06175 [Thermoplasmata archaeon]|nr:hypothetical protein [Thermoplasmata archaeon]